MNFFLLYCLQSILNETDSHIEDQPSWNVLGYHRLFVNNEALSYFLKRKKSVEIVLVWAGFLNFGSRL